MKNSKSVPVMIGVAVLIMLVATACGMLAELEEGYNLVLTVQGQGNARGVSVDYYDVTRLEIEVRQPENTILDTFKWYPSDRTRQYVVNLGSTGSYHLKVTHFCEVGGVEKATEEWATFEIKNYVITMINIVPGAVGAIVVEPPPVIEDYEFAGMWYGQNLATWEGSVLDVYMSIWPDGSYESMFYTPGESTSDYLVFSSNTGTLVTDGDRILSTPEFMYEDNWIPDPPIFDSYTAYEFNGDSLTLYQYFDGNGEATGNETLWTFERRNPINELEGAWYAPSVPIPGPESVAGSVIFGPGDYYEVMMFEEGESVGGTLMPMCSIGSYSAEFGALNLNVNALYGEDPEYPVWTNTPLVAGWFANYYLNGGDLILELYLSEDPGAPPFTWELSRR